MMLRTVVTVKLLEGGKLPWWMGMAYFDDAQGVGVCYVLPLNWIVRWTRALWRKVRWPAKDLAEAAYSAGLEKGRRERAADYQRGKEDGAKALVAQLDDDLLRRKRSHRGSR